MQEISPIIRRFIDGVNTTPDKTAIVVNDDSLTYSQLAEKVRRISGYLEASGARPGDHIGVLLPNSMEFVIVMLAAADLGLVLVSNNMSLSGKALARAFSIADVKHLIAWHSVYDDIHDEIAAVLPEDGIRIIAGNPDHELNTLESVFETFTGDAALGRHPLPPDHPYIITMTSGSTGDPKPIVLSQQTKVLRAEAARDLYAVTEHDITLASTPLYHSLAERLVLLPLMTGGISVVTAGFTPAGWLEVVEKHRVSFTIAVSSQLKSILKALHTGSYNIDSLRCLVSSSERLDDTLKADLLSYLSCNFHECYGASEIAIATNLDNASANKKLGSVGIALAGVDVKILNADDELADIDEAGEIICKTPMLFSGYYKKPEATEAAMWDGYFRTGDLGKLDEDGFLYFLGRQKDIIITGGINVYPKDIEDVLVAHESVKECAVIPMPSEKLGEIVAAVIVPSPECEYNERKIRHLCARELADFQQPHQFIMVSELPKNPMGKVMKQNLIKQLSNPETSV